MPVFLRIAIGLCAGALALGFALRWDPAEAPAVALSELDQRVATAGHRLATANLAFCSDVQWQAGLLIHDLSQYSRAGRAEAITSFGLDAGPAILALAEDGAAARAGIRLNDVILSADGKPLPRAPEDAHNTFAPTQRIVEALEAAFLDGSADLEVKRGGDTLTVGVAADRGCASRFQVVPSSLRRAQADGRYVQLTSALVEYTRDADELAALVAHELAHNILRHRARLNEVGVERGEQANVGRNARLFQQTEREADRMMVYLMDRAGYDPQAAVRLWTRQGQEPDADEGDGTHPAWADRVAAIQAEIRAIAAAKARGEQVRPPRFDTDLSTIE